MKKIISAILGISMLSGAITANAVEINTFSDELKVYVDNTDVYANSENKPLIINDRTVVPLRPIFEALGIDDENIKWYPEESKAIFADGNAECTFVNESSVAVLKYTDGIKTTVNLDVPATIYNGNFYIPIRAYCELWDMGIEWNNSSRSVNISSDKSYEPESDNGDVSQWLGTWYHTDYSDPQSIDDWDEVNVSYENGKYYVKKNGKVDEVVFINSNTAESVNATVYGSNDGEDINNNKLTEDMHIKNGYDFEIDVNGEQSIRIYKKCVETDAMIKAEWQSGYREIPEYMHEASEEKVESTPYAQVGEYLYSNDDGGQATLEVMSINGNKVEFVMTVVNNYGRMAEISTIVSLNENGYATFENVEDNWGNKNSGYVKFDSNTVTFKVTEHIIATDASYGMPDVEFVLSY